MEKTKKVLIISTNAIGDAYLSMSAINPLEKEYGNINFTFVFPKNARELNFNKDTAYKILYTSKSIFNTILMIVILLFRKFDFAFSFFPGRYNTLLLKLCNTKNKAGYYNYKKVDRWDNKSWLPTVLVENKVLKGVEWNDSKNYFELIANVLQYFVTDATIKKYKPYPLENKSNRGDRIIVHGKSRTSHRSFTISQLELIINFLNDSGNKKILILGTQMDNKRIEGYLNDKRVTYLSDLDLEELIEELAGSYLIAIDSFPLHVADAYNTNFIGLFVCTKPQAVLVNSHKSYNFDRNTFAEIPDAEFKAALKEIRVH